MSIISDLRRQRDERIATMDDVATRLQALPPEAPDEERDALNTIFEREADSVERLTDAIRKHEAVASARAALNPQGDGGGDGGGGGNGDASVRVGNEPLIYRRGGQFSFFHDIRNAARGEKDAQERLQRHQAEMRVEMRDITTTAGAGGEFVPPLYLQQQWIELLRPARPFADIVPSFPIPPGTNSITIPRLATGAATAIQASENAAVQETDPTTNSVTAGVKTIAGQVDMSRQLFEFSNPGMDDVLFRDLARDYATKLDVQLISGSGSSGQARGVRNVSGIGTVTYTDATPTPSELYPKIADAVSRVNAAYGVPNTIVMHPRRWAFFLGAVDSAGRPLIDAVAAQNALGTRGGDAFQGVVGSIQGLRVVLDPSVPTNIGTNTNEDVIIVLDSNALLLWEEGAPRSRVFEEVGSGTMTVRLSVWGYFAFTGERYPAHISVITGTGLTPPTF